MKALWVTNIPTEAASRMLGRPESPFGGWLQGALGGIKAETEINLVVASPGSDSVRSLGGEGGVDYVAFPVMGRRVADTEGRAIAGEILKKFRPDIVHIHGTELRHSYYFAAACAALGVPAVVSIQGLVSVIATHFDSHLPASVVHGLGTRPWVRSDRVAGLRRSLEIQGRLERATLQMVSHVIGRTTWDFACTGQINSERHYHHCDETLRPSFYEARWSWEDVRPHSIFLAQGHYPVKGLHLLLRALPAVLARFPDAVVNVAGQSPVEPGRRSPYSRHIARLLRYYGLSPRVHFVGPQTETQMVAQYTASHVVVCPSTIENSPNSIAEAMLLGAPVVAAYVGGIPDMITHAKDGLMYQSDAPDMLAYSIMRMFDSPDTAAKLGERARERAMIRHDPARNARRTAEIYGDILVAEKAEV